MLITEGKIKPSGIVTNKVTLSSKVLGESPRSVIDVTDPSSVEVVAPRLHRESIGFIYDKSENVYVILCDNVNNASPVIRIKSGRDTVAKLKGTGILEPIKAGIYIEDYLIKYESSITFKSPLATSLMEEGDVDAVIKAPREKGPSKVDRILSRYKLLYSTVKSWYESTTRKNAYPSIDGSFEIYSNKCSLQKISEDTEIQEYFESQVKKAIENAFKMTIGDLAGVRGKYSLTASDTEIKLDYHKKYVAYDIIDKKFVFLYFRLAKTVANSYSDDSVFSSNNVIRDIEVGSVAPSIKIDDTFSVIKSHMSSKMHDLMVDVYNAEVKARKGTKVKWIEDRKRVLYEYRWTARPADYKINTLADAKRYAEREWDNIFINLNPNDDKIKVSEKISIALINTILDRNASMVTELPAPDTSINNLPDDTVDNTDVPAEVKQEIKDVVEDPVAMSSDTPAQSGDNNTGVTIKPANVGKAGEDKMDAWHQGTRRQNLTSCTPEKLMAYLNICKAKGYDKEADLIRNEFKNRLIIINE